MQLSLCGEADKPRITKALLDLIESPMPEPPPPPPPSTASAQAAATLTPRGLRATSPVAQAPTPPSFPDATITDRGNATAGIGIDVEDDDAADEAPDGMTAAVGAAAGSGAAASGGTQPMPLHIDFADMEATSALYGEYVANS